ncbi:myomesin-3-like [Scyliorhinus torazame]|uniref:myomesin-3-like n=1 Tax=Scyliorhinus torazame TaxID=75743 RepID=UPI003B5912C7
MATRFLQYYQNKPENFDHSSHVKEKPAEGKTATHVLRVERGRRYGRREKEPGKQVLFGNEMKKVDESYYKTQKLMLAKVDHTALREKAEKRAEEERQFVAELAALAPEFVLGLRHHAVWEKMKVSLSCVIQGAPSPLIKWYKDGVLIQPTAVPGKYTIENKIGLQILEISRCSPEDSGEYSAVATNAHGEASSYATVLVNRHQGSDSGGDSLKLKSNPLELGVDIVDGFDASFGKEGDSLTLTCNFSSALTSNIGEFCWLRDGMLLKESKWLKIECFDKSTTLILPHIHKEDEGLYTMCLLTQTGCKEHSGYVFVRDARAAEAGAPGSPLDVECHDVNKDYVFITWKPPSADGRSPVIGYFIDRCEVGSDKWIQCNEVPEKLCKFPIVGLSENQTYQFRVRAVNAAGTSRPSRISEPVTTTDPTAGERIINIQTDKGKIVITKDELEGNIRIPLPPTYIHVTEIGQTYAALCWNEPCPRGRESLTYYVEKSVAGSGSWQRANLEVPVNCPRFAVTGLFKNKLYRFRVRAANKYGISEPSQPSGAISFGQIPAAPSPPYHIVPVRNTRTSVMVLWKEPESEDELLGFYVYSCEVGTNNWETCNNKPVTSKSIEVHGLTPGKKYVFRVKSVNPAGLSEYSAESTPIVVNNAISLPSAPYGLTQLNSGKNEMIIGWKEPKFPIGAEILGYFLDYCDVETEWHEVNIEPIKEKIYKVQNLNEGSLYQFRAFAMNWAGVGQPSEASDQFKCEEWTMPQPGPPFDVRFLEVRSTSLLLQWQPPLYTGVEPVTGYVVEMCETDLEDWKTLSDKPILKAQMRISHLEEGKTYIFRVLALNSAGTGLPSLPCDPVRTETRPGTTELEVGVDEDGNIFLALQNPEAADAPKFIWSKDYQEITTPERVRIETTENVSKLIFTDPSEEDLGTYSVVVTKTDGVSSSHTLTDEELQSLKKQSHRKRNPLINVKSNWAVELLGKDGVRLWLQVENLSPDAHLRFIINQKEVSSTLIHKINFDKANGIIEMIIPNFSEDDEGSYTAQLQDGKAKGQFTLVLIDEKFRDILSECNFQRNEWKRKQGPYFEKYLHWEVTEECDLLLTCKVSNTKTQTSIKWCKDGKQITAVTYDPESGISSLSISKVTKKDEGVYKAVVADERGQDSSVLEMLNQAFDDILKEICRIGGTSASELNVQATVDGIKLYSLTKCNMEYMKKTWHLNEKILESQERRRMGSDDQQVWLQISNPTEADKGKYTLEMFDGRQTHKRALALTEQVFNEAIAGYQRLKQVVIAERNRAKVVKGLPDVVNIMEDKTLCLSCIISGDPIPEVSWLKNDRELISGEHHQVTVDKNTVTFSIQQVTSEDSGKYSVFVKNKYGSETATVTVGVYKHGEESGK